MQEDKANVFYFQLKARSDCQTGDLDVFKICFFVPKLQLGHKYLLSSSHGTHSHLAILPRVVISLIRLVNRHLRKLNPPSMIITHMHNSCRLKSKASKEKHSLIFNIISE